MDCFMGYLFYVHVFMLNNVNGGRAGRGIAARPLGRSLQKAVFVALPRRQRSHSDCGCGCEAEQELPHCRVLLLPCSPAGEQSSAPYSISVLPSCEVCLKQGFVYMQIRAGSVHVFPFCRKSASSF